MSCQEQQNPPLSNSSHGETQAFHDHLKALWNIAQMTDARHDELCGLILEEIQRLTDSRYSFFGFMSEDERTLIIHSWSKEAMAHCAVVDKPIHFPIEDAGLWSRAVLDRKPLIVNTYGEAHPGKKGVPDGHVALSRLLSVPIMRNEKIVAVAAVANKDGDYSEEDVLQIQTFVSNILLIVEKRRSEELLTEREQQYRSVLETVNDGIILQAASGEILTWNKGAEEIFGITSHEIIGKTSESKEWPTVHEDGTKYEGKDHPSMRTLRAGNPCRNEIMGVHQPDGSVRWISINTNPLVRDGDETPYAVAISFSDITDLKKEKDLSQTYLNVAGVILMALDEMGNIIAINKKGCEILGYPENDLLGRNWFETCLLPSSVERVREIFDQLMSGQLSSIVDVEELVVTRTGEKRAIVWHNTVVKNDRGEICGAFSSGTDITDRKAAEEALRHERDMTQQVMETSPVGIVRLDGNGKLVYANRQAEETLGMEKVEMAGRIYNDPSWRITDFNGRPYPEENLPYRAVKKSGNPVFGIQHGIEWPDGRRILLSINAAPLFNADGVFDGMVAAIEDVTSKVEAEKKYKMLFKEMIDGCALHEIICDDKGRPVDYRFLDINPSFERLTGLKREAVIGRTVLEVMPNTEAYWIDTYGKVALTGEPVFFENFSQEIGRYFQVTAFRPAKRQFACIFVDITERKMSEKALKQSETSLLLAQEIANLGNWSWEIDTGKVQWSDQFFRILGFHPGEVAACAENYRQRVHPDDLARERAMFNSALNAPGEMYEIEHRIVRSDGTERFVYSKGMVTAHDSNGRPLYMVGTTQDITERKEAEQALKTSEEQLSAMLESAMDGFWLIDRHGRLLSVNQTYCRMSGYSETELRSMGIQDLEAVESAEEVKDHMQAIIDRGEARFESRHRRKDGTLFDIEASAQYLDIDGGRFTCFIRDITENKKMEARLAQAQKMESIGNLAGGIAHDFNNILFPIIGLAEMLMDDLPMGSPEQQSALEILAAGKRGGDLIKQILAFSRQSENRKVPVRFQQILKEVYKLVRSTVPSSIDIGFDVQKDCGMIMADATQLHQIAMNLITNAYHAIEDADGRIEVRLKVVGAKERDLSDNIPQASRYALFTVSDTGCGIPSELMEKIFEPYFTTKEQGKGTGLGLAVVFGIVKEHGGDIKVASEVGVGTTFSIYFPLIETAAEANLRNPLSQLPRGTEHILIVDDEPAIVRLEKMMLERLGYRVAERYSSADALEAFKAAPGNFDLVVTDMTMPNMTGDRLAQALISIRPDIPIVICTGFSERINREMAETIGVKAFLMKPIVQSELARTIRELLDERQANQG